jgi:ADP-heptose:LPS heptosyltransferase
VKYPIDPPGGIRHRKRILIYRTGSLGDILVSLPALRLIAEAFPDCQRYLVTSYSWTSKSSPASAILDHTGLIHGYFYYQLRTRSVSQLISLWWNIVHWRADLLVDISPASGISDARRNAFFFRLCGIRHMVGSPINADMQASRPVQGPVATHPDELSLYEPEWLRLLRNIEELGSVDPNSPRLWDLNLTDAEQQEASALLSPLLPGPIIAISVGTKRQTNEWGLERWSSLVALLGKSFTEHQLIVIGSADEHAQAEQLLDAWRLNSTRLAVNLCGLLSPRSSAAALSAAQVLVCQDSGPMHLAAAVKTPCVAIFSSRNLPGVWFPYGEQHRVIYKDVDCKNCGLDLCIEREKKCINSISVEDVITQVHHVLHDAVAPL